MLLWWYHTARGRHRLGHASGGLDPLAGLLDPKQYLLHARDEHELRWRKEMMGLGHDLGESG